MRTPSGPVVVGFPLRGEWVTVRTPAHKIPSHGTDLFGQRYAFDFVRPNHRKGLHLQPAGSLRSFLLGGRTRDYYGDLRQDRSATSPCSRPTRCNSA